MLCLLYLKIYIVYHFWKIPIHYRFKYCLSSILSMFFSPGSPSELTSLGQKEEFHVPLLIKQKQAKHKLSRILDCMLFLGSEAYQMKGGRGKQSILAS